MGFYDVASVERIRRLIHSNPAMGKGWGELKASVADCGEDWVQEVDRTQTGMQDRVRQFGGNKRFTLGNYVREQAKKVHSLAFRYRMEGDADAADRVKRMILLLCREESWLYQAGSGRGSDLWTADIGFHLALAYDCIRDTLGQDDRDRIEGHLYRKAFLPLYGDWLHPVRRIHALDTMGHNWWVVCVSGAGILLLVLGERLEHYAERLHTIVEGLREWFRYPGNLLQNKKANFGPDGDYIETMSYLDYALAGFMVFEDYYRRRTGDGSLMSMPVMAHIPDAYLGTVYRLDGKLHTFSFGDVGERSAYAYVWLRLAGKNRRPDMLAFFHANKESPEGPLELLYYPEGMSPELPPHRGGVTVLEHSGCGIIRDGADTEEGGTLLAVKTGESWNHNHLDVGTFLLISGGHEWVVDSGYCVYSKPLYNAYYRQPRAHNVVLLDGEGQPPEMIEYGTKFEGKVPACLDAPGYKYMLADCTGPYMSVYHRFYRHFVLLDGFMVLVDDLFANREGTFEWLLHYQGEAHVEGETVELRAGGAKLTVRQLYPERKQYVKEAGYTTSFHRSTGMEDVFPEAEYLKIRSEGENRRIKFLSLFTLPSGAELGAAVEKQSDAQFQSFRLRYPDGRSLMFLCNLHADGRVMHDNAHGSFQGIETDAFLSSVLYGPDGRIERISLHNGSYWKEGGRCWFSSLLKGDVLLDYRDGLEVWTGLTAEAWCYFASEDPHGVVPGELLHDPETGMWKRRMKKGREYARLTKRTMERTPY